MPPRLASYADLAILPSKSQARAEFVAATRQAMPLLRSDPTLRFAEVGNTAITNIRRFRTSLHLCELGTLAANHRHCKLAAMRNPGVGRNSLVDTGRLGGR